MAQLSMCRICLVEGVKMHVIINTNLQQIYEKLTAVPLQTADQRPVQLCYICFARLRNCYHLQVSCLKSEEFFTQMLTNRSKPKAKNKITLSVVHPIQLYCCVPEVPEYLHHDAKIPKLEVITVDQVEEGNVEAIDTRANIHEQLEKNYDNKIRHENFDTKLYQANIDGEFNQENIEVQVKLENIDTQMIEESINIQVNDENSHFEVKKEKIEDYNFNDIESNVINKIEDVGIKIDLNHHVIISERNIIKSSDSCIKTKINKEIMLFSEKHFRNVEAIIENNIKLDHSIQCEESEDIHMKNAKIVLDRIDLDCVNTREAAFKKPKLQQEFKEKKSESIISKYKKKYKNIDNKTNNMKERKIQHSPSIIAKVNKKHICDVCDKGFVYKASLILHNRIHTGEKPYTCDVCDKRFSHKGDLLRHLRTHSDQKVFKCDICNKGFNENCKLTLHYRKHTGEKPYMCDVCNKYFSDKNNLIRHTRVHTGVKPYKCDVCNKRFSQKCGLKSHTHMHSSERPFKCDICEKTYKFRNDLYFHLRSHGAKKV